MISAAAFIFWYLAGIIFSLLLILQIEYSIQHYDKRNERLYRSLGIPPYRKSISVGHITFALFLGLFGPVILLILLVVSIFEFFESGKGKQIGTKISDFFSYKVWEEK